MRFGLPENYGVEVSNPSTTNLIPPSNDSTQSNIGGHGKIPVLTIGRKSIEPEASLPLAPANEDSFSSSIRSFNESIRDLSLEFVKQLSLKEERDRELFNKTNLKIILARTSSVQLVQSQIQRTICKQSSEVERIIQMEENARREREEAERKRKEEEERRRQEEERKRQEAERKRQEEERKRLEEERKAKELAQKKKEEEELRKKQQEEEKRKDDERVKRELTEKENELKAKEKQEKERQSKGFTDFSSVEKTFFKYKKDIADIKESVSKISSFPDDKKYANQVKRKINPKFGQLSNSFAQLHKLSAEVVELITMVRGHSNPVVYHFILNFTAKAIVAQAETEVTVKSTAALPLARLTEVLLNAFPEFEYYLSARFVKKCPYIIGYTCSIDSEEGRIRMGWKRSDNKWEQENKYEERVAGICSTWTVLCRLPDHPPTFQLYSREATWLFIARLLNTDLSLISNPHLMVACNWWEAGASYYLQAFGKQAQKGLQALVVAWPQVLQDKKLPGATALRLLGKEWLETGNMNQLKEMEP